MNVVAVSPLLANHRPAVPHRTVVLLCFTVFAVSFAVPFQARGQSAAQWFKQGLQAKTADDKIQAFERAVQLDPNYVEAYFYLGLAYKSKGLYSDAELALNKAYFKNPYGLNNRIKTRILFELGTVYAVLGKLDEARDALQGAKGLASDQSFSGRISYELGRVYLQQGEIEAALKELRRGKSLLPQSADLFDKEIAAATSKKAVSERYRLGVSLLEAERFAEAAEQFRAVIAEDASFKDVQDRLKQAQDGQRRSEENQVLARWYAQAQAKMRTGNLAEARNLLEEIVQRNPGYRDAQSLLAGLRNARPARQPADLEELYQRGLQAFRKSDWRAAAKFFQQVRQVDPGYRDVKTWLSRVNRAQRLAQKNSQVARLYQEGVQLTKNNRWAQALARFRQIKQLDPAFKNIDAIIESVAAHVQTPPAAVADTLDLAASYQEGLAHLQNGDWEQATRVFERIAAVDSTYEDIQNKLADARFHLQRAAQAPVPPEETHGGNPLLWIGTVASLIIVPALGLFVVMPTTRARLYLLQGKYDRAARIYQRLLEKDPGRIKFYPVLANIYLLENRRDEVAMAVYETILRLNIFTEKKREINSIVAQHYLTEGRTDANAIAVMERELNMKTAREKKS